MYTAMDHYIPPPYHRGPRKIVAFRPPLKVLAKFDESIVLGKQRISMSHNRPICLPQVDTGAQVPPVGPLPPKNHTYGIYKPKGKYDNVKCHLDDWQTFDVNKQLRMYGKYHRRRDAVGANARAMDAKCVTPAQWNKFVTNQTDLWCYTPEHTQRSYEASRRFQVPERIERGYGDLENMYRVLAHDYGREWFRNQFATANHQDALKHIEQRMLGEKFNNSRAAYYIRSQEALRKRLTSKNKQCLLPLAPMTPSSKLKNTKARLDTFREDDDRKNGWRVSNTSKDQWECAIAVKAERAQKMADKSALSAV